MRTYSAHRDDRGAIIIQVAFALIALLAFTAFVIDYGVMWVSRRQAQNAVDAGALAGAISLVRDGVVVSPTLACPAGSATPACQSARHFTNANRIFNDLNTDSNVVVALSGAGSSIPPCNEDPGCVRVDVFRNAPDRTGTTRGGVLPSFMGGIIGLTSADQRTRATATAWAQSGNATECLKPWAVADKWLELRDGENGGWPVLPHPWSPTDTFDKWHKVGGNLVQYGSPVDSYTAAVGNTPGTGFTPATDNGLQLMLKLGTGNQQDRISSGWFKALELPCSDGNQGADCYRENIANCTTQTYGIGDTLTVSSQQGNMVGPTEQGVNGQGGANGITGLVEKDPNARWQKDNNVPYQPGVPQPGHVINSAYPWSPRIVPVALFNIDDFLATDPNGKTTITITNIMGFFVEGTCKQPVNFFVEAYNDCSQNNGAVVGRLVDLVGLKRGTTTIGDSSFIHIIQLVR